MLARGPGFHEGIEQRPVDAIRPSPRNDLIYHPIDPDDPDFRALIGSVRRLGVLEPLTVSMDGILVSGHRRLAAAKEAGLQTVPCRQVAIFSSDASFLPLLHEHNRQRVKTIDEIVREEIVSAADPETAWRELRAHREHEARRPSHAAGLLALGETKRRARISRAKQPLLRAIVAIVEQYATAGPLSVRQVHYRLLNLNPAPLMNADRPDSGYRNDAKSYQASVDICARARLVGLIPFDAIHDTTRPTCTWAVHDGPAPFVRDQLRTFLRGYCRDLMKSQPNHVEIVGEKNTIAGILEPVAAEFTIPLTIGRGYCSLPPRYDMAQRFAKSGKDRLILIVLSDFDPEGEDIAHTFARSLRDDFGVEHVDAIKAALNAEQISDLGLSPIMTAKKGSSRRKAFVREHGEHVYELEALEPTTLQAYLRSSIASVLDLERFDQEIESEKSDAAYLAAVAKQAHGFLAPLAGA